MDAVELLNKHINYEKILEHYEFERIKEHGLMIRSCCKMHGGSEPSGFVLNNETGLWYCHTGDCGGGDIYTLVQRMEEISFPQAVRWIADFVNVDIADLQIIERKDSFMREMKAWVKTITSRKKGNVVPYFIDTPVKEVKKFRSFKEETLAHFGVGFVESIQLEKNSKEREYYTLYNRLVVPIMYKNVQVGVSLRKTKAKDFPKWSHQPRSIKTNELLYNYDASEGKKEIVIVEGALDVWAYHEIGVTAVATFGAHITEEQYKLLMRTGADLVFSFDGDEAGRKATEKATELFRYKANIGCVVFDEGEDPESLDRNQLKINYERRIRL